MRTFNINNEDSLKVMDNKIVANVGGQELEFDIDAVSKLVVYTTCMGPLHDDMGLIIALSDDTSIRIMSGHECYESFLFDGLCKALPIDNKKIIEASGCTEPKMFLIYKKSDDSIPCVSCCHVMDEGEPIRFVYRDSFSWQFLCGQTHEMTDIRKVSFEDILKIDEQMFVFKNLEYGDYAEMDEETGEWMVSHDYYPEDEEYDEDVEFPFADSPHTVCLTCRHVMEEHKPILYVSHDGEGEWKFLCGEKHEAEDNRFASLDEILYIDNTMSDYADLAIGECVRLDSSDAGSCESKLEITLEDGEIVVSGCLNLGYIGVFEDEQIELDDTLEEIREWDIVADNLDEDCTDEELVEFLNQYFNSFADRITQNIENINNTFLLYVFDDMINMETDFMEVDELYIEEKNFYNSELDISEIYKTAGQALSPLAPYFEMPNDGSVPKGHIETVLRACFPMFDLDLFIENIEPECIGLGDGEISFQCSDSFDELILCGAYAVIDEELSFSDWHNF